MLITNPVKFHTPLERKRYLSKDTKSSRPFQGSTIPNNRIIKPLKVIGREQPTFKGFYNFNDIKKIFVTTTEKLPKSLFNQTIATLENVSENQVTKYKSIIGEFIKNATTDSKFRKKINLSDDWKDKISVNNLIDLPKKAGIRQFAEAIFSPIKFIFNLYKPIAVSKFGKKYLPKLNAKILKEKEYEKIINDYKGFVGLTHSIKIWENSYRQFSGNAHWNADDEFLIPKDVLVGKIQRRRPKVYDPEKGQYSTKSMMLGNRLTSGLIYSVFLATDAYNTTMKFSGEKNESKKQQKSRFAQENARIGLNLYLQNLIFTTFETQMNGSLANALLASGATVALSETIGRQLVSKPIMPSDKKTLDSMEQQMLSKKGFLPSLGRLMTRVKKTVAPVEKSTNPFAPTNSMPKSFGAFAPAQHSKNVSFTGAQKLPQMFDSKNLENMLNVIKKFDSKQYQYYKNTIENGFKLIKKMDEKDISKMSLEKSLKTLSSIPIGENPTMENKIIHSVFAPYFWIKKSAQSIAKTFKKWVPQKKHEEMKIFIKDNDLSQEFQKFLTQRIDLPVWQKSRFNLDMKKIKIMEEFIEQKQKIKEEIQGVKNILLWLNKQVKSKKIDLNKLTEEQRKTLEGLLDGKVISSDASKQVEYDGNTLAQLNIHLARAITTLFLVTDAYNLTMQYSNDNKKEAQKSAKNRAIQEVTRISISAYMLGFVHNLFSKVCNSSLLGAFTVTAITSLTNDSLARLIVGVPLTPQSREKLVKGKQ